MGPEKARHVAACPSSRGGLLGDVGPADFSLQRLDRKWSFLPTKVVCLVKLGVPSPIFLVRSADWEEPPRLLSGASSQRQRPNRPGKYLSSSSRRPLDAGRCQRRRSPKLDSARQCLIVLGSCLAYLGIAAVSTRWDAPRRRRCDEAPAAFPGS